MIELVAGGGISAATGILAAYSQIRIRRNIRERRWYKRLQNLMRMYLDPVLESNEEISLENWEVAGDKIGKTREILYQLTQEISAKLRTHLTDAPAEVDERYIDTILNILYNCASILRHWTSIDKLGSDIDEEFKKIAKDACKIVTWIDEDTEDAFPLWMPI